MNISKRILTKILVPVIAISMVLLLVLEVLTIRSFTQYAQENFQSEIRQALRSIEYDLEAKKSMALDQVGSLASSAAMVTALKEGNREGVRNAVVNFNSRRKCTFFTILDAEGNVVFRTNRPEQFGDSQRNMHTVSEVLTRRRSIVQYESTPNSPLSIRAGAPVFDENGQIIGAVTGGFRLDTNEWVDEIQTTYGVDCTVFYGETRVATTIRREGTDERATGTPLNNPTIHNRVFNDRQVAIDIVRVQGIPMKVAYAPLFNEGNRDPIGMVAATIHLSRQEELIRKKIMTSLPITLGGLLVFGALIFWIVRAIVVPLQEVTKAAERLAEGILDIDLDVRTKDETGVLADAFRRLAKSLKEKTEVALAIAKGDLTIWVPLMSEQDTLGISLVDMRYGLFDSIKDLRKLAAEIDKEAKSLAQVNQNLVGNTTQSSEQLKEVSASISALHSQTVQNAQNARNAENLTTNAMSGSNEGKERMGRMVKAMDAITKSSDEIKKIIRVIDDIAFQTNLLALNAAVEAARAGQHGKGFAVVAEEVRNLASRSAKAARETAGLIEESIQNVGLGSDVAHETAESLDAIAEQVEQVSKIVSAISVESDRQATLLGEMTGTVGQVSNTAEANMQSVNAVTSVIESVSETAQGLDSIINNFKANPDGSVMVAGKSYEGFVYRPPGRAV